jgi:hypothetical protein
LKERVREGPIGTWFDQVVFSSDNLFYFFLWRERKGVIQGHRVQLNWVKLVSCCLDWIVQVLNNLDSIESEVLRIRKTLSNRPTNSPSCSIGCWLCPILSLILSFTFCYSSMLAHTEHTYKHARF